MPAAARPGFGQVLRELRLAVGMTQAELARLAGVSVGAVRDLEQGRRLRPRPGSVDRLSAALRLDAAQAQRLAQAGAYGRPGPGGGLWLQVLGPVLAWRDGQPLDLGPARQRAVLALLALRVGGPVPREAIVAAVWPGRAPATAVSMVQAYAGRLRRALGAAGDGTDPAGPLIPAGDGYRLRLTAAELDVAAFGELAAQAAAVPDATRACLLYEQALALWHGEPAADTGLLGAHPAVTGLAVRRAGLVLAYAGVACGHGWHDRVLSPLRVLAGQEPLNEPAHAWLMIALAGSGQQAAALQVFADCRARLAQQLGVPPGPELTSAHSLVLRQQVPPGGAVPAFSPG